MNLIKKSFLATAIAAAPFAVNALEALDDEFLGDVTGQEGITIETTQFQTIEEFQYVDGDGDGSTGPGKIKLSDIAIGQFTTDSATAPRNSNDAGGLTGVYTKTEIDAAANGVLITTKEIGQAGSAIVIDASGNTMKTTDASGNAYDIHTFGDGQDTSIGAIYLDNTGQSIGEISLLNQSNYVSSGVIATALGVYGLNGVGGGSDAQVNALYANNANGFVDAQTLISSKASGTGVHITTEASTMIEAAYYTDTDGGAGNQVGVIGLINFRLSDNDLLSDGNDLATGTYIRGAKTEFDLDVSAGKLTLSNYKSESNTILNKIFIGNVNAALPNNGTATGVIGGIAILGNVTEGTISISAH